MKILCRGFLQFLFVMWAFPAACAVAEEPDVEDLNVSLPGDGALAASEIRSVLWVGAHPDDEGYAAPLLAELCVRGGAACHFLVVTDGGKGNCKLPGGGCGFADGGGAPPGSMGALRLRELATSAALFGGVAHPLALEDTPSATVAGALVAWNQQLSRSTDPTSTEQIVSAVAQAITTTRADVVVTIDPRHGVYCHPDHRAAGVLAVAGAERAGLDLARVWLYTSAEPYLGTSGAPVVRAWVPADPSLASYDAAAAATWSARPAVMAAHASQYPAQSVQLVAAFPASAQRQAFVTAAAARATSGAVRTAYDQVCASQVQWNGRGVCPRADGSVGPCW